jgi:hypothetical protein
VIEQDELAENIIGQGEQWLTDLSTDQLATFSPPQRASTPGLTVDSPRPPVPR